MEEYPLRKLILLAISALLVLGVAGAASAAPLNWEGTSTLLLGDFQPTEIPGGGVATVNGSGGLGHLLSFRLAASRGQVSTEFVLLVSDPDVSGNGIAALSFISIQGGTGTFGTGSVNVSGAVKSTMTPVDKNLGELPLAGIVKLCLITTDCGASLDIVLSAPTTVNGVPGTGINAAGVGGLITVGAGTSTIRLSIQGAPWTVKTVTAVDHITTVNGNTTFIPLTLKGFAHGPASGTTSTATPSGVIQLVTPTQVVTNLNLGSNKKVSSGVIMLIHFIPEPGLLLLLGSGVVGLAVLGRKRMQK